MISYEAIQNLSKEYKTTDYPNVVREYFQHLFMSYLYNKTDEGRNLLFKGGTALRIIYQSPRFSEDLDFSIFNVLPHETSKTSEDLFLAVLDKMSAIGIEVNLSPKTGGTIGGYRGEATFKMHDYPPLVISIDVSERNGRETESEIETITGGFVSTYNLYHLSQDLLVAEKIEALASRATARDFYDVYFMMRRNLLNHEHKERLNSLRELIINTDINFKAELGTLFPSDQQNILSDFKEVLARELKRQLSG